MTSDTLQRKVWVSLAMTIAFMVATILLVSIPASRFASPAARELRLPGLRASFLHYL